MEEVKFNINGGQAFPSDNPQILIPSDLPEVWRLKIAQIASKSEGMSLRDWFAGKAMPRNHSVPFNMTQEELDDLASRIARFCYVFADAMLKERAK